MRHLLSLRGLQTRIPPILKGTRTCCVKHLPSSASISTMASSSQALHQSMPMSTAICWTTRVSISQGKVCESWDFWLAKTTCRTQVGAGEGDVVLSLANKVRRTLSSWCWPTKIESNQCRRGSYVQYRSNPTIKCININVSSMVNLFVCCINKEHVGLGLVSWPSYHSHTWRLLTLHTRLAQRRRWTLPFRLPGSVEQPPLPNLIIPMVLFSVACVLADVGCMMYIFYIACPSNMDGPLFLTCGWLQDGRGNPKAVLPVAAREECHVNGAAPSLFPRTGKEEKGTSEEGPVYKSWRKNAAVDARCFIAEVSWLRYVESSTQRL